jgi:hypothetical protein
VRSVLRVVLVKNSVLFCLTLVVVCTGSFLPCFCLLSPLFYLFLHWAHTLSGIIVLCFCGGCLTAEG